MMNSDKIKKILIIALISVAVIGVILGIVIICTTLKNNGNDEEEHSFTVTQVAPTCTESGYTLSACFCGLAYKTDYIPALGHDYKQVSARNATCELVGYNDHQACTRCDSKLGYSEQAALGHIWDDGKITLEVTCETDGNRVNKCVRSGCGVVHDFVIPATGHDWEEIEDRTVEATCETSGEKHFICKKDNKTRDDILEALGHAWEDVTVKSTCTESGRSYQVCKNDQTHIQNEQVVGGPLGHNPIDKYIQYESTDDKYYSKHYQTCLRCEQEVPSDHNYTYLNYSNDDPYYSFYHYSQCGDCGVIKDDESHEYEWKTGPTHHAMGCSLCKYNEASKLHTFSEDECSVCKYNTWTDGLVFSFNETEKTCAVTGIGTASGNIKIPKTYKKDGDTYTVTTIASDVFKNAYATSVTTYSTLTSIENNAFAGCKSITSLTLGDNITRIGDSAFEDCANLTLTSVVLPTKLEYLGESAFKDCKAITNIEISVPTISAFAFSGCKNLNTITINGTVKSVEQDAFKGCSSTNTKVHTSTIGSWCEIDFANEYANPLSLSASIYIVGKATPLTQPDLSSITVIKNFAFTGCISFSTLVLDSTIEEIGEGAFKNCKELIEITIPNENLRKIGDSAFENCGSNKSNTTKKVYITDVTKWCTVDFADESANPLYIGAKLYRNTSSYATFSDNGIEEIKQFAFAGCTNLTSVTLNEVTKVGKGAFIDCESLHNVTIRNNATDVEEIIIEEDAFFNIKKGSTVHVKSIEQWCAISFASEEANPLYNESKLSVNNSLYHTFNSNGITEIKDYAFVGCTSLTSVNLTEDVTSVGKYAFANCASIKTVTVNKNVTSIGEFAFAECVGITKLYIHSLDVWSRIEFANEYSNPLSCSSKYLYLIDDDGTNAITTIDLSASTNEEIKAYAFYGWDFIETVKLSENLKKIGKTAFGLCVNVSKLYVPSSGMWDNLKMEDKQSNPLNAGNGDLYINGILVDEINLSNETGLTEISAYRFSGQRVRKIILPSTVTKIGDGAFANCTLLEEITSLANVTEIGEGAFAGCTSLESIELSENLTAIPANAFKGCTSLTEFNLGSNVKTIGADAFRGCRNLETVRVDSLDIWYQIEFIEEDDTYSNPLSSNLDATLYVKTGYDSWSNDFGDVTFKADVIKIPDYTFQYSGVTSVTIPNTVETIGEHAFYGCSSLQELTVESSKAREVSKLIIGGHAFFGCSKLEALTLYSVKSIGVQAFGDCTSLKTVEIYWTEQIGSSAFSGCCSLENLTIPFAGMSATAEAANDKTLFGCIFGTSGYASSYAAVQKYDKESGLSKTYYIPNNLTTVTVLGGVVRYGAFYSCEKITTLTIGEGVTAIENCAFAHCHGITTLNFNAVNCSDLAFSEDDENYDGYAFYKAGPEITTENEQNENLGMVINIGSAVERIPAYIFRHTDTIIKSVTFNKDELGNSSCKTIGASAFLHVPYIAELVIPDSVTTIGQSAFENCEALTTLTIGEGVTSIEDMAFKGCSSLNVLNFRAKEYMTAFNANSDETAFSGVSPMGSGDGLILKIGSNVTNIPDNFLRYSKVKYILFEENTALSHIGTNTVGQGASGFVIYYTGTREKWGEIAGSVAPIWVDGNVRYYSEDYPTDPRVYYWHYVNGEPTKWTH